MTPDGSRDAGRGARHPCPASDLAVLELSATGIRDQTSSAVRSETTSAAPANSRGRTESEPLSAWAGAGVASTLWSALLLVVVLGADAVADSASAGVRMRVGAGCSGSTDSSADTSFQLTTVPSE